MGNTGLDSLDRSIHKTNEWLAEAMEELHTEDRSHAYNVLRATLHAVRDNLNPDEAADFASQLPLVLRGAYYEGWKPSSPKRLTRSQDEFFERITSGVAKQPSDPERFAKMTFKLLQNHMDEGQISHVKTQLPNDVQRLWT